MKAHMAKKCIETTMYIKVRFLEIQKINTLKNTTDLMKRIQALKCSLFKFKDITT